MRVCRAALIVGLTTSSVSACSPPAETAAYSVVDSAGIEIITSPFGAATWSTSDPPLLSLGVVDAGGPTEFFRVRDLELLDSGRVAVANSGSEEVRVFGPDGEHLWSFGGEGRGPEEFLRLEMVEEWSDSLLTYDEGNDRIQVRGPDGEYVRSFRLEWFNGMLFPVDLSPQGLVLAVTARYMTELSGSGRVVDTALVSLYDLKGQLIDSLARLPHNERFVKSVGDFRTTVVAPFSALGSLISIAEGFCYAFGPEPEVRCFDQGGSLNQILRVDVGTRPVTEADIAHYWDEQWAEAEGAYRETLLRVRDDMVFPSAFPAISQLLLDDEERVWARRYQVPRDAESDERWWIFEQGRLIAQLTTPEGVRVMDVEGSRVAGVWSDELGIEHVRVYQLVIDDAGGDSP